MYTTISFFNLSKKAISLTKEHFLSTLFIRALLSLLTITTIGVLATAPLVPHLIGLVCYLGIFVIFFIMHFILALGSSCYFIHIYLQQPITMYRSMIHAIRSFSKISWRTALLQIALNIALVLQSVYVGAVAGLFLLICLLFLWEYIMGINIGPGAIFAIMGLYLGPVLGFLTIIFTHVIWGFCSFIFMAPFPQVSHPLDTSIHITTTYWKQILLFFLANIPLALILFYLYFQLSLHIIIFLLIFFLYFTVSSIIYEFFLTSIFCTSPGTKHFFEPAQEHYDQSIAS